MRVHIFPVHLCLNNDEPNWNSVDTFPRKLLTEDEDGGSD